VEICASDLEFRQAADVMLVAAGSARVFPSLIESEGDSQTGRILIQAACWKEASMHGARLFLGSS
jgi:hypothetical protein